MCDEIVCSILGMKGVSYGCDDMYRCTMLSVGPGGGVGNGDLEDL